MLNQIKKSTVKLSLAAILAIVPSALQAASGSAAMEGSSESSSAIIESANIEQQVNRINVGINFIRLNTDILERMPISEDSEWVDNLTTTMTQDMYKNVLNLKSVKNDPYYSTVHISNAFLGRVAIPMTMLNARLYHQMSAIYKNETNGYKKNKLPDLNTLPSILDLKSYITFKDEPKVEVIDVAAINGNLFKNVEEATLSLLPESVQEDINEAKSDYKSAKDSVGQAESKVAVIETWLEDDKNANSPEIADKKTELATAKAELEEAKAEFDVKEDIYFKLIESGIETMDNNFDESKIKLAQKIDKLLNAIDNNAIGAGSLFTAATTHIAKNGITTLEDELKAITLAQAAKNLVGDQKDYLVYRASNLAKGIVLSLPNIAIGSFYAIKQVSLASEYQSIVDKILDGAKALEEQEKALEEDNKNNV
jgi:hypothetical protein